MLTLDNLYNIEYYKFSLECPWLSIIQKKPTKNSIPYNPNELRKKPNTSDEEIRDYLKHFDPSYSYSDNENLDRGAINNGIVKVLTKTYPINNPQIKTDNKKPNTTNIQTKYRDLQTDMNYNIFKTNIAINKTQSLLRKQTISPSRERINDKQSPPAINSRTLYLSNLRTLLKTKIIYK